MDTKGLFAVSADSLILETFDIDRDNIKKEMVLIQSDMILLLLPRVVLEFRI